MSEGVGPVLDDRIGDQAPEENVGIGERRVRWQLDTPARGGGVHGHAELGGGTDHGLGGAVGDAGVQGDLGVRPIASSGRLPRPGLQQRIGEERAEAVEVVVVELALHEHQVGDPHVAVHGQTERTGAGGDGRCPGVVVAGPHREATEWSTPGRHWLDPTAHASPGRVSERKVSTPVPATAAVAPACAGG